jgi:uncharacterized protein YyaL (SSP411 family)
VRRHLATADDYAALIAAALALSAAFPNENLITDAEVLFDTFVTHHWDDEKGAFYFAAPDAGMLIIRTIHGTDDVTPNANSLALANLAKLYLITGKTTFRERALRIHDAFAGEALANPFGYASLFSSWMFLEDPIQVTATGSFRDPFEEGPLRHALELIGPDCVVQYVARTDDLPLDHPAFAKVTDDRSRIYICRGPVCAAPATTLEEVGTALELLRI